MNQEQIRSFLQKYQEGNSTEEEHQQFIDWLRTAPIEEVEAIAEEYKTVFDSETVGNTTGELVSKIEAALDQYELGTTPVRHLAELRLQPSVASASGGQWKRWAVAAAVVLLLVSGYLLVRSRESRVSSQESVAQTHDVKAPDVARATLKLADGKIVYLDSVGNGKLAVQGNVSVVKTADGQINYQIASSQAPRNDEIKYNTITNPRGSKVQTLTLIDGTQVWLNAESSITYPTAFVGNERKISMTGEADFLVAHNEKMPFKVVANGVEVKDIGTEFNVNAYDDEDAIRVTLLEGSVKVSRESVVPEGSGQAGSLESETIKPGEQVVADPSTSLRVTKNADLEQVMAWKNGSFIFKSSEIESIMNDLMRWYDVEIVYEGKKPEGHYAGMISRNTNLSEVLKVLSLSGVKTRVEGKKLIVSE